MSEGSDVIHYGLYKCSDEEINKVKLLERAALDDDVDEVKRLIEQYKTFEFSARALGLACLYSSLEMVKVLAEAGATFDYDNRFELHIKYKINYTINFSLLIIKTNDCICPNFQFDYFPSINKKENSQKLRADIAEYLLTQPNAGFDSSQVLFYSILWGCSEVSERLIQKGVKLNEYYIDILTKSSRSYVRSDLTLTLSALPASKVISVLKSFILCLEGSEKKIILTQKVFDSDKTSMLEADVLKFLFAETNTSKLNKAKLLEKIIDKDDVKALAVVVDEGAIKSKMQREKAIYYAAKQKKHETVAWLINYIDKTVDTVAEETKEEAKIIKEFMADPNSVSALKKKWSYKKLENGTLQITSYKGCELEVEIPEMIGKEVVTVIADNAFTASDKARNKNENRKNIVKVTVPKGIVEIGRYAFAGCKSMETIVLPSSIRKIEKGAFLNCENLININISKATSIGDCVFDGCVKLRNQDGMIIFNEVLYNYSNNNSTIVVIPKGVTTIANYAFNDLSCPIEQVVLPQGLKEVGKAAFDGQNKLQKINIPSSVKKIMKNAFRDTGLEEINLTDGLQRIGESAFANSNLSKIHIPKSVTAIGPRAFFKCEKLKDIYIPASPVKFGKEVFGYPGDSKEYMYKPYGICVHTSKGSLAEKYMKQYSGIHVVNDYPKE